LLSKLRDKNRKKEHKSQSLVAGLIIAQAIINWYVLKRAHLNFWHSDVRWIKHLTNHRPKTNLFYRKTNGKNLFLL